MKIAVVGDTHGSESAIRRFVAALPPVDLVLHTGDYGQDGDYIAHLTGLEVLSVAGNCDGRDLTHPVVLERIYAGRRLCLTHGHKYMLCRQEATLTEFGRQRKADIVVFGHTHVPYVRYFGPLLLLNPGSTTYPKQGYEPSFAILNLGEKGLCQVELRGLTGEILKIFSICPQNV